MPKIRFQTAGQLQDLRLTNRALHDQATPILFRNIHVKIIDNLTLKKLRRIASRPHLSKVVRELSYHPYIRKQLPDSKGPIVPLQHFAKQNQILSSRSLERALKFALQSFKNISAIGLEFPEHGKRVISNTAPTQIPRAVISSIFSGSIPSLSSLSIRCLQPEDLPNILGLEATGTSAGPQLSSLTDLILQFYTFDTPNHRDAVEFTGTGQLDPPHRLPGLLERLASLVSLRITFTYVDKRMRLVDWMSIHFPKLRTIELQKLEISELSLKSLTLSSAGSLREIILTEIFLLNGTWDSFYQSVSKLRNIADVSGLRGRRYVDNRQPYSSSDARSFCELFKIVEMQRVEIGLPSMRDPVRTHNMELIPDFWDMECVL
ncbi:hypothetical protein DM02DRAFT_698301 [Periconia macrospinosa]|uniref:F-box domain-containing protein n=1 Tax=Periconia macrospinosa TaxID=97972 RepID=A0A2V1D486_9PLEO|nr:hypothetical protein DM02DRAFT_698301 [Periconia macrospinosa]